jgi:hypothetical protein
LTEEGADIIAIDIDITVIRDLGRRPSARKSIELRLGGFRMRNTATGLSRLRTALRGEPGS